MSESPSIYWHLSEFPPDEGGIGTFAATVLPHLAAMGERITGVVAQGGPGREDYFGVHLVREPLWAAYLKGDPRLILRAKRRVAELRREIAADAYHIHLCEPSALLVLQTADIDPGPIVVTFHGDGIPELITDEIGGVIARFVEAGDVFTAVSLGSHRRVIEAAPQAAHRLVPIRNGLNPGESSPLPHEPRLLAVGRLVDVKGFDRLIRALPGVVERVPDVHLDVLGQGVEREALETLATELGVDGHVTFHGFVNRTEVREAFARSRLVVAPSKREGLPYALLEAASVGRAVVGANVAGIDEVVIDGESGRLVDPAAMDRDPSALATAIADLLEDDSTLERMSAAARRHVVTEFSAERCAAAYAHLYRAITAPAIDVAVVIPAFNAARHIAEAVGSALSALDHAGCSGSILVVDDGCTDDTADVVRAIDDTRVEVFRQPNLGQGVARNTGLALTRSEFVAHLDADDVWPLDRLTRLLDPFEGSDEVDAVFGAAEEFTDDDAPSWARWNPDPQAVRLTTTGLVRRRAHDRFGGFPPVRGNDQIRWSTHALVNGLEYRQIDDVVLRRRIHATNNSHNQPFTTDVARIAVLREMRRRKAPND